MTQQSTILIVDDHKMVQKHIEVLLQDLGYRLIFADDGPEALAKATKHIPDLILLDVMLPGMDGYEVCRRLRAHKILAEVPIIMVTALNSRESRLRGIAAGADDFITKPFDGVELSTRVQSIIRLNRYRRLLVERVRFRWVIDNADEGYLIVNEEDHIMYANPRARFYLGFNEENTTPITTPFLKLVKQHYNCEPQEAWKNWPDPPLGDAPRYLVRPETENARSFWLKVDILNLPSGPDMSGTVRLRDVTDKMNTLRDMRSFNASITHKLLTPLVHLTGNLDLLSKYYRAEIQNPDMAELFEVAHKGSRRLKQEIGEIVQYTRDLPLLAHGEQTLYVKDLAAIITETSAELGLGKPEILQKDCPDNAKTRLSKHAFMLIVTELLENAKKFHPQHKPTLQVSIDCPTKDAIRLQIMDDGITLSPEQLAQVWTPYYQGEKHFTGEIKGMGLGLTMVSTLVWGIGGTCRMYNRTSEPGLIVELTLPLAQNTN